MFNRNKVARLVAEFLGAGVLTLVMVSVQRSTIGVPYFVGVAAGLAMAMLILVFGRASGGHFNPAVTVALWTARQVRTLPAILYIVMQLLGGYLAGLLYQYLVNNDVSAVSHTFSGRLLVAEAIGAFILSLGWAAAVYNTLGEAKKAGLIGGAYVLGIIAASAASVGIVNPAVALGANAWAWGTYVLGPVLGAVIGVNLYGLVFAGAPGRTVTAGAASNATADRQAAVASQSVRTEKVVDEPATKSEAAKKLASKPKSAKKTTSARKKTSSRKK